MRRRWSIVFRLFVLSLLAINCVQTGISLSASHYNYPGADALIKLHTQRKCKQDFVLVTKRLIKSIVLDQRTARVHIDVYSAENGVSRFLEMNHWT